MKKFNVTWTEHVKCSTVVEAKSEQDAMYACYDIDNGIRPGTIKREAESTSDWSAKEVNE